MPSCQKCGKKLGLLSSLSGAVYCSECIQSEIPRCSTCNSQLITASVATGFGGYAKLGGINKNSIVQVCLKCMKAKVEPDQIPNDSVCVFVGRVVRIDRERYDQRIVQIQADYPQDLSGKILKFSFYHSIKKGDRIAVAGQLSVDQIEAILVRNMSAASEKTGGSVSNQAILRVPGAKELVIDSPLFLKARSRIDEELKLYEQQIARTVMPPDLGKVGASGFEMLVADLFERLGYQNVMIAGGAGDKGVDIMASGVDESSRKQVRVVIQCKHQSVLNRVMPTQIRDFAHTIEREKANGVCRGYFVTSSYFSPECFDKANCGDDMELIDRDQLEVLLKKVGLPIPELR